MPDPKFCQAFSCIGQLHYPIPTRCILYRFRNIYQNNTRSLLLGGVWITQPSYKNGIYVSQVYIKIMPETHTPLTYWVCTMQHADTNCKFQIIRRKHTMHYESVKCKHKIYICIYIYPIYQQNAGLNKIFSDPFCNP